MEKLDLPAGWAQAVVGDYFYLKNGFAFKSNDYIPASENTFPVIRISDLDGKAASDKNAVHVLEGAPGFEVKNGDLLIAMSGATTGKIGVYQGKEPAYQNQRVGNLKLYFQTDGCNKYKNYLVHYLSDDILKIAYGGAQPNISGKAIEEMDILLPPLAEQKVIADKLDTLLAQVENTKARLKRIPQILKRFRQSVLAAAVSGRLTEEWRDSKPVQATWRRVPFSELLLQLRSGAAEKAHDDSKGIPILRSSAVRSMEIDFCDIRYLPESAQLKADNYLRQGDLLFTRLSGSAEYVGNCALVKNVEKGYQYPDRLFCARLKAPEQGPFLEYFFASQTFRNHIVGSLKSSAGHQRITLDVIRTAVVAVPATEEQTEIVRRVDHLFAHAERIEKQVNSALHRVNNLAQSILAKAFRGELTEQWRKDNPDLISGENSAKALLERIKAEQPAASKSAKKIRKQTTS